MEKAHRPLIKMLLKKINYLILEGVVEQFTFFQRDTDSHERCSYNFTLQVTDPVSPGGYIGARLQVCPYELSFTREDPVVIILDHLRILVGKLGALSFSCASRPHSLSRSPVRMRRLYPRPSG